MLLPRRIVDFHGLQGTCRWLAICLAIGFQPWARAVQTPDVSTNTPTVMAPSNEITHVTPEPPPLASGTNTAVPAGGKAAENFNAILATAHYLEKSGQSDKAEPILVGLLAEKMPDTIKQTALFELGAAVRMENDLPRAESICAQFLDRWPNDPRVPEVLLRQGQIFRQMGLNSLAMTKFYAVMTAALSLKSDRPNYYPSLVLEAQTEIADTHYLSGRYGDAADFYLRLIKQSDPALNRPQVQFRLIHSLASVDQNEEAASQAKDFLTRFPDTSEQPEVRFYLAQALKKLGHNNEALQQILMLLQEQKVKTQDHPEVWAYWQQRAGNEIGNQLYREGDYIRALDVYVNLAQLDAAAAWQVPVKYQIGLTYERLFQPQKAVETYNEIIKLEADLSTNTTPGQKAVFDMARWRVGFLGWEGKAETANRSVASSAPTPFNSTSNPPSISSLP